MTNGTKSSEVKSHGDCEYCPTSKDVDLVNGMCIDCSVKQMMTGKVEVKSSEVVEVTPSISPINERLKKAYLDKYNSIVVSGMNHDELMRHIADQEDMIKVLQAQVQASMDVDEEWSKDMSKADREAKREKDRQYRAKARPRVNSDGTLKVTKAPTKPKEDVAPGNAAYESLVKKIMMVPNPVTGKMPTREQVVELLGSMGKKS